MEIYTDGSCIAGNGGWAFCIVKEGELLELNSGGCKDTTNNRMELEAVLQALYRIESEIIYTIYTDSQLTMNCATGNWKRNKNLDLWGKFDCLVMGKNIVWKWVKGHSGNKYNELVDKEARKMLNKI